MDTYVQCGEQSCKTANFLTSLMKLTNINQPITKLYWETRTLYGELSHCNVVCRTSGMSATGNYLQLTVKSLWDWLVKHWLGSLPRGTQNFSENRCFWVWGKNHYQAQNEPSFSLNKNLLSLKFATTKNQNFLMIKKDVFCLVTSTGQRKNSESPWGIEPLTFKFYASMLYYWATETLQWARSITKFIWHASCILLGSAMIVNIESIQEGKKWSR